MGALREFVRSAARSAGVEIQRWPQADPLWRVTQLLLTRRVDVILDVGANDGDYARAVRRH